MEKEELIFDKAIGGFHFVISQSLVIQWVIIAVFGIAAVILTRNLKRVPGKRQTTLETLVGAINGIVSDKMGEDHLGLGAYVGALGIFLLLMNLTGLIGIKPATTDYNIALGMALTTFIMVQAYAIKKVGAKHYLGGYLKPMPFMIPMTLLERVVLPVSLSLRLFGNMLAAATIMELVYEGLGVGAIGIGLIPHAYFDIFDGTVQMIVFTMLTMVNIKIVAEH